MGWKRDEIRRQMLAAGTPDTDSSPEGTFSRDEIRQEVARGNAAATSLRAATVADVVSVLLLIVAAFCVLVGVLLAMHHELNEEGVRHYPLLGTGVTVAVAGVVQALVGLMLSQGVSAVAKYVYYRTEFDYFE